MKQNPIPIFHWKPPSGWQVIETVDLHTAGEPMRVITRGLPEIPGNTILEKRRYFRENLDFIRRGVMWEPRGHAIIALATPVAETWHHTFVFDPDDTLKHGFFLR